METKRIALLGGLVVLGGFMFVQMKNLGTPPPQSNLEVQASAPQIKETPMTYILVSTSSLNKGSRIAPEMLEWKKWPADSVSAVFFDQEEAPSALEDYMGAIVRSELAEGEPITERKLIKAGDKSVMAAIIRPGYRAVTIRITSDSAAAGFINPGDKVDIILTRRSTGAGTSNFFADTVFEDVSVLSIDQTFQTGPENGAVVLGSMATFELTQEDAEALTIAQSAGDLSLTLRPMSTERGRAIASHSTFDRDEEERVASLTVYRGGQTEEVILKGQ